MYKYVDQKSSAAILAIKRSAGVTPEVNLRNPLHTNEKACLWVAFETQHRHPQKFKTRVSVPPKKDLCPPKISKKKQNFKQVDLVSQMH